MKRIILLIALIYPCLVSAQSIKGVVTDSKNEALISANVIWVNTTSGTITDTEGRFELYTEGIEDKRLVVSYVGYEPDTILVEGKSEIKIELNESQTLQTVEVKGENPGAHISSLNPIKTEVITDVELTKSACCDLAGCFNSQSSVEPNTTNQVTNAKELRILGLSGVYNQVLFDGLPLIQGLSYTYGISTVPGTLIKKIYVAKGANSVLQGYESISGQINVVFKEPEEAEKLLLNVYGNSFLEKQFNANYSKKWNKWSTLLAAHATQPANKIDTDEDNFLDLPLLTRYSILNKWQYGKSGEWGWHSKIGLRYVNEQRIGGQVDFNLDTDKGRTNQYGQVVQFSQPEIYTKTGYRLDDYHHFVLFGSILQQNQDSYYGTLGYEANQVNAYLNFQYEHTWNDKHSLKTGLSYRHFDLEENLSFAQTDTLGRTYSGQYLKKEQIPGVFAENTFNWKDNNLTLITGVRADHHNDFGWFVTPRALLRYNITENTTARVSAGTGWRTVNLFSENIFLLSSSRDVIITEELQPEKAINYGANLTHRIYGSDVETVLTFDYYRTQFTNQIFPDYNAESTKAYVSNFTGTSISNGFQAELGLEFFERLGTKFAYNFLDVYRIIDGSKYVLPFNAKHRLTGILSYKPQHKKWHFDMNLHWFSVQNLANTAGNPPEFQRPDESEPYTVVNAQWTKSWTKLELYLGCENIFNFRQLRPLISWENPFGPYFDSSSVWGPTRGREFYVGLRFKIDEKKE